MPRMGLKTHSLALYCTVMQNLSTDSAKHNLYAQPSLASNFIIVTSISDTVGQNGGGATQSNNFSMETLSQKVSVPTLSIPK